MSRPLPLDIGSRDLATSDPESADPDKLVHWLLGSLKLDTTIFHVGQYCGSFRASTAGRSLASYHLVLAGRCFVHIEGQEVFSLGAGDAVFFLTDLPHFLGSEQTVSRVAEEAPPRPMQRLDKTTPSDVALACGFFQFRGELSQLLIGDLPDYLVIRADTEGLSVTRVLFDLILAEADRDPEDPSPLIARLADVLFFYVLRHVARHDQRSAGLWSILRRPEFASLVTEILENPGKNWSIEAMARAVHMSRASFFKRFVELSGKAPAQFLLLLRMRLAAPRLRGGDTITEVADQVGYQSVAAFSRAFERVIGETPGAYRKATHR